MIETFSDLLRSSSAIFGNRVEKYFSTFEDKFRISVNLSFSGSQFQANKVTLTSGFFSGDVTRLSPFYFREGDAGACWFNGIKVIIMDAFRV